MVVQEKVRILDLSTLQKGCEGYPEKDWFSRVAGGQGPILLDVRLSSEGKVELLVFAWQDEAVVVGSSPTAPWLPPEVLRTLLATGDRLVTVSHTESREQAMMGAFGCYPNKKTLPFLVEQSGMMSGMPLESLGLPGILTYFACKKTPYSDDVLSIGEEVRCALSVLLKIVAPEEPGRPSQNISLPEPGLPTGPLFEVDEALKSETVEARDDGLWCVTCQEGPIYGTKIMELHTSSPAHRERLTCIPKSVDYCGLGTIFKEGLRVEVPKHFGLRHIECVLKDDDESGWVMCKLCKTGHINNWSVMEGHIKNGKHLQKERAVVPSPANLLTQFSWNLPDYIKLTSGNAMCPWCSFKCGSYLTMRKHLESPLHQATYEKHMPGQPKDSFSKEWGAFVDGWGRLIVRADGGTPHPPYDKLPLVWTSGPNPNFNPGSAPANAGASAQTPAQTAAAAATSASASASAAASAPTTAASPASGTHASGTSGAAADRGGAPALPPGWKSAIDKSSGNRYFYHRKLNIVQWSAPSLEGTAPPDMTPASTPIPTPTPSVQGGYPPYTNGSTVAPTSASIDSAPQKSTASAASTPAPSAQGDSLGTNTAARTQDISKPEAPATVAPGTAQENASPLQAPTPQNTAAAPKPQSHANATAAGHIMTKAPPTDQFSAPSPASQVSSKAPPPTCPKQSSLGESAPAAKASAVPNSLSPCPNITKAPPPGHPMSTPRAPNTVSDPASPIATKAPPPNAAGHCSPSQDAAATTGSVASPASPPATKAPPPSLSKPPAPLEQASTAQSESSFTNHVFTKSSPPTPPNSSSPGIEASAAKPASTAPLASPSPAHPKQPSTDPVTFSPAPPAKFQEDAAMTKAPPSTAPNIASAQSPLHASSPALPKEASVPRKEEASSLAAQPTSASCSKDLPPGWKAVWDPAQNREYYADIQTQTSTWTLPSFPSTTTPASSLSTSSTSSSSTIPPELCKSWAAGSWRRAVDEQNLAYWYCLHSPWKFYELGGDMRRLQNGDGRIYWTSLNGELRFFEEADPSS